MSVNINVPPLSSPLITNEARAQGVHSCDNCANKHLKCEPKRPCTNCTRLFVNCFSSPKRESDLEGQQTIKPNMFSFKIDPTSTGETIPLKEKIRKKKRQLVPIDFTSQTIINDAKQQKVQSDNHPGSDNQSTIRSCERCRKSHLSCDVKKTSPKPCSRCFERRAPCISSVVTRLARKKKLVVPTEIPHMSVFVLDPAFRNPELPPDEPLASKDIRVSSSLADLPIKRVEEITSHYIQQPFDMTSELQLHPHPIDTTVTPFTDHQKAAYMSSQEGITSNHNPQQQLSLLPEFLSPLSDIHEETDLFAAFFDAQTNQLN